MYLDLLALLLAIIAFVATLFQWQVEDMAPDASPSSWRHFALPRPWISYDKISAIDALNGAARGCRRANCKANASGEDRDSASRWLVRVQRVGTKEEYVTERALLLAFGIPAGALIILVLFEALCCWLSVARSMRAKASNARAKLPRAKVVK